MSRYRYSVTIAHRRAPLPIVTDRYRSLPNFTVTYRYLTLVTQVTVKFANDR